jgi:hypothetical protein
MLFNTKDLEFWVMETTNIFDFLHLLSLIKIRPNMDLGGEGGLAFSHICHNTLSFFLFFLKENGERLIVATIHLFISIFFELRFIGDFNEVSFDLCLNIWLQ